MKLQVARIGRITAGITDINLFYSIFVKIFVLFNPKLKLIYIKEA